MELPGGEVISGGPSRLPHASSPAHSISLRLTSPRTLQHPTLVPTISFESPRLYAALF